MSGTPIITLAAAISCWYGRTSRHHLWKAGQEWLSRSYTKFFQAQRKDFSELARFQYSLVGNASKVLENGSGGPGYWEPLSKGLHEIQDPSLGPLPSPLNSVPKGKEVIGLRIQA